MFFEGFCLEILKHATKYKEYSTCVKDKIQHVFCPTKKYTENALLMPPLLHQCNFFYRKNLLIIKSL